LSHKKAKLARAGPIDPKLGENREIIGLAVPDVYNRPLNALPIVAPCLLVGRLMKRCIISLLFIVVALVAVSAAEDSRPVSVTFYHTSDLHEHSAPLPRIAGFVAARKKEDPNVLLVDTGDWFNKGDLTELNTRGEAMAAMLGACKYDALIPGNHDYSFGTRRLAELIDEFKLPVVAANCTWPDGGQPAHAARYRIFKLAGVTVAVIGTATPISTQMTDSLLKIQPMEHALGDVVADLEQRTDIIVLLTHVGTPVDEKLARALPGLDIIFGGHDHRTYQQLAIVPGTDCVIQHSGANGQRIGALTITWDGEKIVDRQLRLVKVTDELPNSVAVAEIAEKYRSQAGAAVPTNE
jgi:2',3'-cyclic-nucleotide 2'-phosphodiesterase (5'-nucleotidase family)